MNHNREHWGLLALLQLVSFMITFVLLGQSIDEIRETSGNALTYKSALLQVVEFIETSLIGRIDRFLSPNLRLESLQLEPAVAVWALVSIIGNLTSALLLIVIAVSSLSGRWTTTIVSLCAFSTFVISLVATPLLFAIVKDRAGTPFFLDISVIAICLFALYLAVDGIVGFNSSTLSAKRDLYTLAIGVDLPCLLASILLFLCGHYGKVPAAFSIGASAGLLVLYSFAFFFLCWLFWARTPQGEQIMKLMSTAQQAAGAIAVGAALNGAIGFLVQLVKLPFYIDLVGSILVALLFGPVVGVLAAVTGIVVVGILTTPITIAYVGTAIGVTACAYYLKRWGFGRTFLRTVLLGTIVLGPVSSLLSIPVTTYLFGGVTFTGSDYVTAALRGAGLSLLSSVSTGAFFFDAIDKGLTSALVYFVYVRAPVWLRSPNGN